MFRIKSTEDLHRALKRADRRFMAIWWTSLILSLAFSAAIIYIALHFIFKYW